MKAELTSILPCFPLLFHFEQNKNKMVREPNVSLHKQIIKDDDVKECISTE